MSASVTTGKQHFYYFNRLILTHWQ